MKKTKIIISIVLIVVLIFMLVMTIALKLNNKTKEQVWAENNKITIGSEEIRYVDLTTKPEDYEKIIQKKPESKEQTVKKLEKTEKIEQTEKVELSKNDGTKKTENNTINETAISKHTTENKTQELENSNKEIVNIINENSYNIEFDLNYRTATIDGNKVNINEIIDNKDASNDQIYQYVTDNIVGDIEYSENSIKVNNPYSSNTILIETSNIEKIKSTENIQSIVKISDDIYSIHYANSKDTKTGFEKLKDDNAIQNVAKDCKVSVLENESEKVESLGVTKGKEAWGIISTGLENYKMVLNNKTSCPEIKVAVLDTGVRTTHEVFKNQNTADRLDLTYSYNYVGKNKDISDDFGHGTMVAGIIAEATSNNVKIVPVKITDNTGNGYMSNVIEAMKMLINKVDVINLSLGVYESELKTGSKEIYEKTFKDVYDAGISVVCATGNDGIENVYYPASSNYTFAVGSVLNSTTYAPFSNYGNSVDFVAPGYNLTLPYYKGDTLYNKDITSEETSNSGTSFSSPYITSAISMIKTENKDYSVNSVKNELIKNVEDLGEQGKDKYYGYGFLNLNKDRLNRFEVFSFDVSENKENNMLTIVAKAFSANKITHWAHTTTQNTPSASEWREFSSYGNMVTVTYTAPNAQGYYIWFKDEKGNIVNKDTKPINSITMYGDINGNSEIDQGDILALSRHYSQISTTNKNHPEWILDEDKIKIGDMNSNNEIDMGDILVLLRYIAAQNSSSTRAKHPDWAVIRK